MERADQVSQELTSLLFGKSPYERTGAPEPELLAELAPALNFPQIEIAFKTIAGIGFMVEGKRIPALVRLLKPLPAENQLFRTLLGEGLLRFPGLAREVPEYYVPIALEVLREMEGNDEERATVMAGLADRFPEGPTRALLQAATFEELERIAERAALDLYRSRALFQILDTWPKPLSVAMASKLIRLMGTEGDPSLRAGLLARLIPLSRDSGQELAMHRAVQAAKEVKEPRERTLVFMKLSDYLSGPPKAKALEEAFSNARLIDMKDSGRTWIFAGLSLRLSGRLREQAIEEAAAPYKQGYFIYPPAEEALSRAFADIAPNLPDSLKNALRERIQSLPIPDDSQIDLDLVPYLSEEQLAAALERSFQLDRLPWPHDPSYRLSRLGPHLSEKLLIRAVDLAAGLGEDREVVRGWTLIALAPYLKGLVRPAIAAAKQMRRLWWRGRALQALVPFLPESEQEEFYPEIEAVSSRRMCKLMAELPEEERDRTFWALNESVWDHYGGGAPPPGLEEESYREPAFLDGEPAEESMGPPPSEEGYGPPEIRPGQEEAGEEVPIPSNKKKKPPSPPFQREADKKGQVVNTGFSPQSAPALPIDPGSPLACEQDYYFWLEVGAPVAGSMEVKPTPLPRDLLPEQARLKVVLFPFQGGLRLTPGATLGELQLLPGGEVKVAGQPFALPAELAASPLARSRLFFPVATPERAGTYRLRCSIYYKHLLVQSRLIRARVMRNPHPVKKALRSTLDYTLTHSLRAEQLSPLSPYRLSLMLNDNGDGTHSFRFFGQGEVSTHAHFDAGELQDLIHQARGALRRATWGDEEEWREGKTYLYEGAQDYDRLKADLVRLAIRGYRFYDQVIDSLAGEEDADRLTDLMRKPGLIQIAFKESERLLLPASMIYDHPLNTALGEYQLCSGFTQSLQMPGNLEDSACFQGNCPSYHQLHVVCPGGFWGFRHALGMPLSIGRGGLPVQPGISYRGTPQMIVGVSTDPAFKLRENHEKALQDLTRQKGWQYQEGDRREEVISLLRNQKPQFVYFYCHGGMLGTLPYIKVGAPAEMGITRDNLRSERIRWKETRPLVFINGCHTTALEPEKAFNFVGAFVKTAYASGVIGTEITIFEQLGRDFAQEFLPRFLSGKPVGQAVREARLALLKKGNPLGLVYLPFALADLRLAPGGGG